MSKGRAIQFAVSVRPGRGGDNRPRQGTAARPGIYTCRLTEARRHLHQKPDASSPAPSPSEPWTRA